MNFFIELNETLLIENIQKIEEIAKRKIMPVIKANAYGHGLEEILNILEKIQSISHLCVAYFEEAVQTLKTNSKKKIIIMMPTDQFYWHKNFEFFLSSFNFLEQLVAYAQKKKVIFKIHIKINTGMNRFGFHINEIPFLFNLLNQYKQYIEVVGIASHLGRLNYNINTEIKNIITDFEQIINEAKKLFGNDLLIHPFAGRGFNLIDQISSFSNAIRVGGIMYGLISSDQKKKLIQNYTNFCNNQIMTLKAKIIGINDVQKGSYIGYSNTCLLKENKKIIIVAFGYSLGYDFLLSCQNEIEALYKNQKIKLIGTVGMNHLSFDVTNIKEKIILYDYVILFSNDNKLKSMADISLNILKKREYTLSASLNPQIIKKIVF